MKSEGGTYALIMHNRLTTQIQIGRWGILHTVPGYYIYVGSAFGPGGVRARVLRHCRREKPKHWHIDYLSEALDPFRVWCSYRSDKLEHRWAMAISKMRCTEPIKGFGCSDCQCDAHLFASCTQPKFKEFVNLVGDKVRSYAVASN